jgi:O-antigen/teichoic acid export membrane protein
VLLIISLALFLPFVGFGRHIFGFIFGVNWVDAGEYVEIISIAMMVRFVVSPLSSVFISTSYLKVAASWQTLYFFTTIALFFIGRNLEIKKLLSFYVVHEVILYILYFSLMVFVSKKFDNRILCVD